MGKKNEQSKADLFINGNKDSQEARKLLNDNKISYSEWKSPKDYVPEPGFDPPVLNSREGQFRGVEGIKRFIDIVKYDSSD